MMLQKTSACVLLFTLGAIWATAFQTMQASADENYEFVAMSDGTTRVGEIEGRTLVTCPPARTPIPYNPHKDRILGPASCSAEMDAKVKKVSGKRIQVEVLRTGTTISLAAGQLDSLKALNATNADVTLTRSNAGVVEIKSVNGVPGSNALPSSPPDAGSHRYQNWFQRY